MSYNLPGGGSYGANLAKRTGWLDGGGGWDEDDDNGDYDDDPGPGGGCIGCLRWVFLAFLAYLIIRGCSTGS